METWHYFEQTVKTWHCCEQTVETWHCCEQTVETWHCCGQTVEAWNCCEQPVDTPKDLTVVGIALDFGNSYVQHNPEGLWALIETYTCA